MEYYSWPIRENGSKPTQRPTTRKLAVATIEPEAEAAIAAPPVELNDVDTKITNMFLLKTSIMYQTKEFFNNSTLHGVRYIGEKQRPFGERLMWFTFTMTGFIAALVIIVSLWEKFQTNPTITGEFKFLILRAQRTNTKWLHCNGSKMHNFTPFKWIKLLALNHCHFSIYFIHYETMLQPKSQPFP